MSNKNLKMKILLAGYDTIKDFAADCGIAQSTITNSIHGQKLSLNYKFKILKQLNKARKKQQESNLTIYDLFPDTEKIEDYEIKKAG